MESWSRFKAGCWCKVWWWTPYAPGILNAILMMPWVHKQWGLISAAVLTTNIHGSDNQIAFRLISNNDKSKSRDIVWPSYSFALFGEDGLLRWRMVANLLQWKPSNVPLHEIVPTWLDVGEQSKNNSQFKTIATQKLTLGSPGGFRKQSHVANP